MADFFNLKNNQQVNVNNDTIKKINYINIHETNYSISYDPYIIFLFNNYNIEYEHPDNSNLIFFNCHSIQTIENFIENNGKNNKLSYNNIVKLIYDTGILIKYLEEERRSIFCFSLNDYVVINNNFFFFINPYKISNIYRNSITLKIPINVDENFLNINTIFSHLPYKEHYTNSYYSFGLMVFYLLTEERYSNKNNHLLKLYYQTPIYYFLLRCLNTNPQERSYLYI